MRSLFVLSLPRSLSTLAYHAARISLHLSEPAWTSDGELLNNDRFVIYGGPTQDAGLKYSREDKGVDQVRKIRALLDDVVCEEGRAYKDVVQPFVLAAWLAERSFPVLRIHRPLADVAFSMLANNWLYPARAAASPHNGSPAAVRQALLCGLIAAEEALDTIPAETVELDDLVADEAVLTAALSRLYPNAQVDRVRYIDDGFRAQSEAVFARRATADYHTIENQIHHLVRPRRFGPGARLNQGGQCHEDHQRH